MNTSKQLRFTIELLLRAIAGGFSSFCGPESRRQDRGPLRARPLDMLSQYLLRLYGS